MNFEKLVDNIYRLCVPFENIYTSVFAVNTGEGWLIFDSGSNDSDANGIVIPAIEKMGFVPGVLFASHDHGDHAGGIPALKRKYPDAEVKMFKDRSVLDGEVIFGCLKALNLKGHSADSAGIFDVRTKTLLSGDSLQLWGVGRYGIGVQNPQEYIKTADLLLDMDINMLIASHDYSPLGFFAEGGNVKKYIIKCKECLESLTEFVKENKELGSTSIAELINKNNPQKPPVPEFVVEILCQNYNTKSR